MGKRGQNEGTIRKRKDGRWEARAIIGRTIDGKPKFKYIYKDLKLSEREWLCPQCGKEIDRDYNASLNILDEGLRQLNL